MDWLYAIVLVLIAFLTALAGLISISAFRGPLKANPQSIFAATTGGDVGFGTVFLFDGDTLVDATAGAKLILASSPGQGSKWTRLLGYLSMYFPDVETQLERLSEEGQIILEGKSAQGKTLLLTAALGGGLTRIILTDPAQESAAMATDTLSMRAQAQELDGLRDILARVPVLIWRENTAGEVVWANAAYLMKSIALLVPGKELSWPLPRLFERMASQNTPRGQRASLTVPGHEAEWFDLAGTATGDEWLVFAMPADAAVNAENALRDFMQTLTKTFAQLPTGLAIFDRQRQLQLFNPALLDLTGLPPDFLSLRPSLLSVLDALRDRNMIPEPKDYRSWRRQLVEMEKAAASGLYEENWNLPDGQTFKVVGRPHPNGALALMIEDITNEVSRSRRYRSDLELGQSVIDEMEEAVAVFSPSGHLVMSNLGYALLWAHDPQENMSNGTIREIAALWRQSSAPALLWSEAEEYISTVGNRVPWKAEARLLDGRLLMCRFAPLAGGSTLAAFRTRDPVEALRPIAASDEVLKTA